MSLGAPATEPVAAPPSARLSTTDRFLPVWIGAAMVARSPGRTKPKSLSASTWVGPNRSSTP